MRRAATIGLSTVGLVISTRKKARVVKGHTDAGYAVAFSPAGRLLASAGADRTIRFWNLAR